MTRHKVAWTVATAFITALQLPRAPVLRSDEI
jgi:hypothetical protein